MPKPNPEVKIVEDLVVTSEVMASSLIQLSEAAKRMEKTGLNRRALLTLLKGQTGVSMATIDRVLDALPKLAEFYTTKKQK